MTDIVERLNRVAATKASRMDLGRPLLESDAADEITRLRAELADRDAKLRAVVEWWFNERPAYADPGNPGMDDRITQEFMERAAFERCGCADGLAGLTDDDRLRECPICDGTGWRPKEARDE